MTETDRAELLERIEDSAGDMDLIGRSQDAALFRKALAEIKRLGGVIYRNCDPFLATPGDEAIIAEISAFMLAHGE
jgi:hypothetical protein